jgi:non-lysosomal glucosylceramidase
MYPSKPDAGGKRPGTVILHADLHGKREWNRRSFLRLIGAGALVYLGGPISVHADPLDNPNFDSHIPADKNLKPEWVKALFERGTPEIYRGDQLRNIAMPISGICTGQELNLSGEGALVGWRVPGQDIVVAQGFSLRTVIDGKTETHLLNRDTFPDLTFRGEYPIAKLEYAHAAIPVEVSMEAFSPYIPLDPEDSGLPATIFNFTLKNTSASPIETTLAASWENGICGYHRFATDGTRRNQVVRSADLTVLNCTAAPIPPDATKRDDVLVEDWSKDSYQGWTVEGTAFGAGPVERSKFEERFNKAGGSCPRIASSSFYPPEGDIAMGKLTSSPFTLQRHYLNVWFGGGSQPGKVCVNLLVDGEQVGTRVGRIERPVAPYFFDVRKWEGKQAIVQIVDSSADHDGCIFVDRIFLSDIAGDGTPMNRYQDFGSMAIALMGQPAELVIVKGNVGFDGESESDDSKKSRQEPVAHPIDVFVPLTDPLIGTLGRTLKLGPGATGEVTFILAEFLPNLEIRQLGPSLRYYTNKFKSAQDVAEYVAANFKKLTDTTRLWRDTWYDSTLPYWFLDRTFVNASTPATGVCYRIANGRFYAFEGAPAPNYEGTCTHVWQYAHSLARTFPQIERDQRERVDLGIAFDAPSGVIAFRGEASPGGLATDGQAGTIMRFYREHQMSPDDSWLKRNWDKIKLSYNPLFNLDKDEDGILEGNQNNTLDCGWYGQIAWMSSMYVGALRAGEQMAREMNDSAFAEKCARIAQDGANNISSRLFNGEYFFNIIDPKNAEWVNSGDGCHIDQVYGESWALQIGLGPILPEDKTRAALKSIWKYNFSPDANGYIAEYKIGRWFVYPGDAGMLMCTFPRTDWDYHRAAGTQPYGASFAPYFNETWTGQEYQVAAHMFWAGMVQEGLAIVRAIHDRYSPNRRNPWQEEEAGIHYSRAMASHGAFLAIGGYEYHGPKGHLGFAPRLAPENFRTAFTAAEGWGTFAQTVEGGEKLNASVEVKYGQLRLLTLALVHPGLPKEPVVKANLQSIDVPLTWANDGGRVTLKFANPVTIPAGQKLSVEIG